LINYKNVTVMKSDNLTLTIPNFRNFFSQLPLGGYGGSKIEALRGSVLKDQAPAKKNILIIDNEWNMLKLLYSVLSPEYNLTVKNSAIEALKWLERGNQPALIVCEFQLPYFSGESFIKALRNRGLSDNIPLIVLSETAEFEQKLNNSPYKIDGMIRKPFNPIDLKSTIYNLINEYKPAIAC